MRLARPIVRRSTDFEGVDFVRVKRNEVTNRLAYRRGCEIGPRATADGFSLGLDIQMFPLPFPGTTPLATARLKRRVHIIARNVITIGQTYLMHRHCVCSVDDELLPDTNTKPLSQRLDTNSFTHAHVMAHEAMFVEGAPE